MPSVAELIKIPKPVIRKQTRSDDDLAPTYYVNCWNDPVNLMVYVSHFFMKIVGWNKQKADKNMVEAHENGKVRHVACEPTIRRLSKIASDFTPTLRPSCC